IRASDSDTSNATGDETIVIKITGSNDAPVVDAIMTAPNDSSGTATPLPETNAGLTAQGTLTVTDADKTDTDAISVHQVTVVHGVTSVDLNTLKGFLTLGTATSDAIDPSHVKADSGAVHNVTWNFDSGNEAFNSLSAGETLQLDYSIKAHDSSG